MLDAKATRIVNELRQLSITNDPGAAAQGLDSVIDGGRFFALINHPPVVDWLIEVACQPESTMDPADPLAGVFFENQLTAIRLLVSSEDGPEKLALELESEDQSRRDSARTALRAYVDKEHHGEWEQPRVEFLRRLLDYHGEGRD